MENCERKNKLNQSMNKIWYIWYSCAQQCSPHGTDTHISLFSYLITNCIQSDNFRHRMYIDFVVQLQFGMRYRKWNTVQYVIVWLLLMIIISTARILCVTITSLSTVCCLHHRMNAFKLFGCAIQIGLFKIYFSTINWPSNEWKALKNRRCQLPNSYKFCIE